MFRKSRFRASKSVEGRLTTWFGISCSRATRMQRSVNRSRWGTVLSGWTLPRLASEWLSGSSDPFRYLLSHSHTVRNPNAIVCVADKMHAGRTGQAGFDFLHSFLMTDDILRHRAGPSGHSPEHWLGVQSQDLAQLLAHGLHQRVVAPLKGCAAIAAEETPEHHLIFGHAMGKFRSDPCACHDALPLAFRHQESEPVQATVKRAFREPQGNGDRRVIG